MTETNADLHAKIEQLANTLRDRDDHLAADGPFTLIHASHYQENHR